MTAGSALALALSGCTSTPSTSTRFTSPMNVEIEGSAALPAASGEGGGVIASLRTMASQALELAGLKPATSSDLPKVPDSALPDRRITWRIHASSSLNTSADGHPLALLTRLYRLRSPDAFLQAAPETFGDPGKEKNALGDDLVAVREVQLIPGQQYEMVDKVPRDVRYLGVVALFREPTAGRWRYAFSTATAEASGLTLGAHACAMSVQVGEPIGQPLRAARAIAMPCP